MTSLVGVMNILTLDSLSCRFDCVSARVGFTQEEEAKVRIVGRISLRKKKFFVTLGGYKTTLCQYEPVGQR